MASELVSSGQIVSNLFPHEKIRPSQDQLMQDLDSAFTNQKILLAHAPTGLGKTAAALSIAVQHALKHKKRVFFLTNRHTQHQIAINTLKMMKEKSGVGIPCADLIGKRWMCNQEIAGVFGKDFAEFCKSIVEKGECEFYNRVHAKRELTVEAKAALAEVKAQSPFHNEELTIIGQEKKMCSYELAMELAKDALVIVGDYNYVFNPFVQNNLFAKLGIELQDVILIVDEGHNLPGRMIEMASTSLTTNMIKNAILEAKKFGHESMISWLQEINRTIVELAQFSGHQAMEKMVEREEFCAPLKKILPYEQLQEQLELAADEIRKQQRKSSVGGISNFLDAWKGDDHGYARIVSEQRGLQGSMLVLNYACLDPSIITKPIFDQVYCGVLMSGTLRPTFMYADLLGITKGVEQKYESPFPPEHKLTLIVPETTTKFSLRGESMYQLIAEKCSELIQLVPGNIALFFPSYDLRDKIGHHISTRKKLFWEKSEMTKEEKEVFLNQFKEARLQGAVLMGVAGANFAEGVDLPGDLLNGVVVVGLPLARPDLKTRKLITYYDEKFGKGWDYGYVYPALNKCFQSAGRCIRSETDRGAVIFLDERFAWENYFCCFPKEGVRVSKEYTGLLREFFGR